MRQQNAATLVLNRGHLEMKLPTWIAVLGLVAICSSATATTINDTYHGGNGHGYGDVIAAAGVHTFDVDSLDATLAGNQLTVVIYTDFAGHAGISPSSTAHRTGIGYGDLFLSTGWNPKGSGFHDSDNASNGNHWTYAFSLDNPTDNSGGNGTVYALGAGTHSNHNPDVLRSDHFIDCGYGCTYRNGQAVAVDTHKATATNDTGTWTVGDGFLSFSFDIAGLDLDPDNLGLHWTMYCGNDVIEGLTAATAVPEPKPLGFFFVGLGLIGLAVVRRRRTHQAN